MADLKISELNILAGSLVDGLVDYIPVYDKSAEETKRISVSDLSAALLSDYQIRKDGTPIQNTNRINFVGDGFGVASGVSAVDVSLSSNLEGIADLSLAGQGGKFIKVNSGESGWELGSVDLSLYAPLGGASFTGAVSVSTSGSGDTLQLTNSGSGTTLNIANSGSGDFFKIDTNKLVVSNNGNLAVDTNTLFVDAVNNRVGFNIEPLTNLHLKNNAASVDTTFRIQSNDRTVNLSVFNAPNVFEIEAAITRFNAQGAYPLYIANQGVSVGFASTPSARLHVKTASTSTIGAIIQAAAGQTANLQEWRDSANNILARVTSTGRFGIGKSPDTNISLDVQGNIQGNYFYGNYFAGPVFASSSGGNGWETLDGGGAVRGRTGVNMGNGSYSYFLGLSTPFSPTSSNNQFSYIRITPTINQTGGTNGVTRALFIDPILTSAADWRSIEWANNTGRGLWGSGTANNAMAGALHIGSATNANTSAIMEVTSTTKGFLPPRMTGAQVEAIASPAEGLIAYATNAGSGDVTAKGLYVYNGANWVPSKGLVGVTASAAELNILDGATLTTTELNILDGATLTTTELNYVDGVTSAIQTQIDGKLAAAVSINTQTASYTLVLADANKLVRMNVASANDLTIPPNSSVAFGVGTILYVEQMGAGTTTIVAGSGVTINPTAKKTPFQYGVVTLMQVATDVWNVIGGTV